MSISLTGPADAPLDGERLDLLLAAAVAAPEATPRSMPDPTVSLDGPSGRPRRSIPLRIWQFPLVLGVLLISVVAVERPAESIFNLYVSIAWSLYAPIALLGLLGALLSRRQGPDLEISTCTTVIDDRVIIVIPTLCQPGNLPALKRVVTSILLHAPQNLTDYRIDVVIDEGDDHVREATRGFCTWVADQPEVRVLVVPEHYETPNGARFKTRANHFALERRRADGENTASFHVYHLDDDTSVGSDTIASIAEFISTNRNGEHLVAQGVLAFPSELTPSRFANLADSIRPADDTTRFRLFTGKLGMPLAGFHGEHLLARADIEDEIGWDFADTVIEDAFFALQFARRHPGKSTFLNSLSYGASPANISDLVKQRRRWSEGLLKLIIKRNLPWKLRLPLAYFVFCWISTPFQFIGILMPLSLVLTGRGTEPVVGWVGCLWAFSVGFLIWQYLLGYRINNRASAEPRPGRSVVVVLPLILAFSAIEGYAVLLGLLRFAKVLRPQTRSEVIYKPL